MTLKTSLFNKGVYKSTVKRFYWGSLVYFLALFVSTSLAILLGIDADNNYSYWMMREDRLPLIFRTDFAIFPLLLATVVPTIVSLLVFRFVHSKRQSIFIHSLPVGRTENYISSLLASFTLMAVPVILNGIILAVMSLSGYGEFFTVGSCFLWIGISLAVLFILFAYSTFVSMITGNSFAMLALNVLIHVFLLVIAGGFGIMADAFIYGYANENKILNFLASNLPVTWIYNTFTVSSITRFLKVFNAWKFAVQIGVAALFYLLSFVVYKLRRMETAEDVAGFKCLNPVFKYLATGLAALGAFSIFSSMISESWLLVAIIVFIVSAIAYFACEMILRKSLKVWRSYRGYAGFAAATLIVIYIFAFTSFFGYETNVPKTSDIDSVAVYNYYYQEGEPFVADTEVKELAIKTHNELSSQAHVFNDWMKVGQYYDMTYVTFVYKLDNGDSIKRRYPVTYEKNREIMNALYDNENYKKASDSFFSDNIKDVYRMTVYGNGLNVSDASIGITDKDDISELIECIRKDKMSLSYDETVVDYGGAWTKSINLEYTRKDGVEDNGIYYADSSDRVIHIGTSINMNYKNTIDWLEKNGYGDVVKISDKFPLCINKNINSRDEFMKEDYNEVKAEVVKTGEDPSNDKDYILLSEEDETILRDSLENMTVRDLGCVEYYTIYAKVSRNEQYNEYLPVISIEKDNLPEYLKKYL